MIIDVSGARAGGEGARTPFLAAFDPEARDRLADSGTQVRGRAMAVAGLVGELRIRPHGATGTVTDAWAADRRFEVRLSVGEDGPGYACTCGDGSDPSPTPAFCAHAVAVALVATGAVDSGDDLDDLDDLDDGGDGDAGSGRESFADGGEDGGAEDPFGLRPFLSGLTHDELVDLVLDLVDTDDMLANDLLTMLTSA